MVFDPCSSDSPTEFPYHSSLARRNAVASKQHGSLASCRKGTKPWDMSWCTENGIALIHRHDEIMKWYAMWNDMKWFASWNFCPRLARLYLYIPKKKWCWLCITQNDRISKQPTLMEKIAGIAESPRWNSRISTYLQSWKNMKKTRSLLLTLRDSNPGDSPAKVPLTNLPTWKSAEIHGNLGHFAC